MSVMNNILGQIVEASGGTVTRSGNRNGLLKDWFNALETPVIQIAKLNGTNQHIEIPDYSLVASDTISMKVKAPSALTGTFQYLIAFTEGYYLRVNSDGTTSFSSRLAVNIDGNPAVSGVTMFPMDSLEHTIEAAMTGSGTLKWIGARGSMPDRYIDFPVYDFAVTASSGNRFYGIHDGWSNNPQIADSVGGQNATAILFTESTWINL